MSSSTPLISIVMPFKNSQAYLEECIKTIRTQTYSNWELIAVNDFSEDDSLLIFKELAARDVRIKVLQNHAPGIIGALQTALAEISGQYLTRMDSDDLMPKDRLEKMFTLINSSPPKTVVTGLVKYFSDKPISTGYRTYEKWLNDVNSNGLQWQNIYRECVVASPNWMVRTEEVYTFEGFNLLKYPEDYHLVLRWYEKGFQICSLDQVSLLWREHPNRTSRNSDNYSQQKFFELKISSFLNNDYKSEQLLLWGSGVKARLTASILKQFGVDFERMDLNHEKFPNGIDGHAISSYMDLKNYPPNSTQILLSIYPTDRQKKKLENFLNLQGYTEGRNFWYL